MEVFKLLGTVAIDSAGAERDLDRITASAKNSGSNIASALGGIAKTVGTVTVAAVSAVATGLTALTKSALDSAGELEQNMGGAIAVFGETIANDMVGKANEAFSKLGLSTSDYLATANKMGALFQGSGFNVEESADMASQAMQRAADVASIMGIDVSSAMEAVAGAAKGNFTMMDNLGVAINDTTLQIYAEEKGLGKLETTQQKVNAAMQMFLDRTTYAEGNYEKENDTLAGSLTTLKAAWDNWLSGAGDTDALADSVINATDVIIKNLGNILPRLVEGLSGLIERLAPEIPTIIQTLLPSIITGAIQLVTAIVPMIPEILLSIVTALVDGIGEAFGQTNLSGRISEWFSSAWATVSALFEPIIAEVTEMAELAWEAVTAVWSVVGGYFEAIWEVIKGTAKGLWSALVEYFTMSWENIKIVWSVVTSYFRAIWETIKLIFSVVADVFTGDFQGAWDGVKAIFDTWSSFFQGLFDSLMQIFSNVYESFVKIGSDVVNGIKQGISSGWEALKRWFNDLWDSLFGNLKVDVDVNGSQGEGQAKGLDYVPYNNFPALLHKGEAVLTAGEADNWRSGTGGSGNGISIIQNIQAVAQTPIDIASATAAYFEQARWAI